MDVNRCLDAARRCNGIVVPLPGGSKLFRDLTVADKAWLATTRTRIGQTGVAKKALVFAELLDTVIHGLDAHNVDAPVAAPLVPGVATVAPPVGATGAGLAIVPYVRGYAPPGVARTVPPPRQQPVHMPGFMGNYVHPTMFTASMAYRMLFWLFIKTVVWAPVLITTVLMSYIAFGMMYIVYDPRVVVKGFFFALDLPPNYAQYVLRVLFDQVREELVARFR
jgi:hypothetical protein